MREVYPKLRVLVARGPRCLLGIFLAVFAILAAPASGWAQGEDAPEEVTFSQKVAKQVEDAVAPVTDLVVETVFYEIPVPGTDIAVKWVLIWLAVGALVMTLYFKFVNIRSFGLAIRTVKGRYSNPDDPGEITHFQALSAALSATVGLGNIAGVAVAISIGGPGATVWMIIIGLLGMSAKFAECTLGVKYRKITPEGKVYGGPMHYLEGGLGSFGKALAIFFAVMCIGGSFGGGNMYQVNQAAAQFADVVGADSASREEAVKLGFGIVLAILVAMVIIGGIVKIAKVTSRLVPFMCIMYMLAAVVVILCNLGDVPEALGKILKESLAPAAGVGGVLGVFIQGVQRAAFSNEAGIGSAPIAHSAVKTNHPASEGIVALLEPFIDTVVVCTMTALVIVITGTYQVKREVVTNGQDKSALELRVSPEDGSAASGSVAQGAKLVILETKEIEEQSKWEKVEQFEGETSGWVKVSGYDVSTKEWKDTNSLKSFSGIPVTSMAFETVISWFPLLLSMAVILFAFSTMISWSYYGQQAWAYLFGRSKGMDRTYKVIFCVFIVVGAVLPLSKVLDFSDAMIFAMAVPNVLGLYLLAPVVKRELESYLKATDEIDRS